MQTNRKYTSSCKDIKIVLKNNNGMQTHRKYTSSSKDIKIILKNNSYIGTGGFRRSEMTLPYIYSFFTSS